MMPIEEGDLSIVLRWMINLPGGERCLHYQKRLIATRIRTMNRF
jgi:hypothetical protein